MSLAIKRRLPLALCALLACSVGVLADDDDRMPSQAQPGAGTELTAEQQGALGIVVAHPRAARLPGRIEALGLVLDPATLVSEAGEMAAAGVAEQSAQAEVRRLQRLYGAGAGASLKMLEAAQADESRALAQAQLAAVRFARDWGPLERMPPPQRERWLTAATGSHALLVRADLPGWHSVGSMPDLAELDVDGMHVPGRVLGVMQQLDETQSVGLLVGVEDAPAGLGVGAHLPVTLLTSSCSGVVLPRDAVLYDDKGAYVFKRTNVSSPKGKIRYVRASIKLLVPQGAGWLVEGVNDDDDIVLEGAGALWSLEATGGRAADDDDDDN